MELQSLTDEELLISTKSSVTQERNSILNVLQHLREVERRLLFARSYPSLFEYCVGELGYEGGTAQSRISSMRLLRDMPEFEEDAQSGKLTLTTMSQAQSFFRNEKIKDPVKKREIVRTIVGKPSRQVARELLTLATVPEVHRPERVREISETHSELRVLVDSEMMKDIELLKEHLSEGRIQEVLRIALKEAVLKRQPKTDLKKRVSLRAPEVDLSLHPKSGGMGEFSSTSDFTPKRNSMAAIKREVIRRDENQCTHRSPEGLRCTKKTRLELDHIYPKAKGGEYSVENLRLRCRTHNQWAAVLEYGQKKMSEYIPILRN